VKIVGYSRQGHQSDWVGKFVQGLKKHGIQPEHRAVGEWVKSDIAVVWGERNRKHAESIARKVLVLERGYFQDRFTLTSIGWDGLNGRADFCNADSPPDRWLKHGVPVSDWKEGGRYVLILGQVPGDMSHRHADINQFYADSISRLSDSGLSVVFRPHPLGSVKPQGCLVDADSTLEQSLSGAAYCVTFNSNSGVDAVLAGVPTITMDKGAMAWDVTGHNYAEPPRPDREQWLNNLAYCQWDEAEIESGEAWQHLKKGLAS